MVSNAIADFMATAPLAEEGGAISSDRFDYQKNWALARLLSLHQGVGNYVLLCELHEDIAVLDCPQQPSTAVFYQIKTSDKNAWTLKKLINRKKGEKGSQLPSILGRLCAKAAHMKGQQVTFQFVTNHGSGYSFKKPTESQANESSGQRLFEALSHDEWESVRKCLKDELGGDFSDILKDGLRVSIAQIPLGMHNQSTLGLVTDFLDQGAKGIHINPKVFYRSLFDELRRKTVAKRPTGTIAEVCKAKGIDRQEFDLMLKSATLVAPAAGAWGNVLAELHKDGVSLAVRTNLRAAYPDYFSRMQSPLDATFRKDYRFLVAALESAVVENQTLLQLAEDSVGRARKVPGYGAAGLSPEQELIVVMMAFYEVSP